MLRADMGQEAAEMPEAGGNGPIGQHADIPANQAEIDINILEVFDKGVGQAVEAVQVEICQQENTKSIKGLRKGWKAEGFFLHLDFERIASTLLIKACYLEDCGEENQIGEKAGQIEQGLPSGHKCMTGSPFSPANR